MCEISLYKAQFQHTLLQIYSTKKGYFEENKYICNLESSRFPRMGKYKSSVFKRELTVLVIEAAYSLCHLFV